LPLAKTGQKAGARLQISYKICPVVIRFLPSRDLESVRLFTP